MRCRSAQPIPVWRGETPTAEAVEPRRIAHIVSWGVPPTFIDPAPSGKWIQIGPSQIATPVWSLGVANGRVDSIAVSPADERIVLMGANGGGYLAIRRWWRKFPAGHRNRWVRAGRSNSPPPIPRLPTRSPTASSASIHRGLTMTAPFLRSTDGGAKLVEENAALQRGEFTVPRQYASAHPVRFR